MSAEIQANLTVGKCGLHRKCAWVQCPAETFVHLLRVWLQPKHSVRTSGVAVMRVRAVPEKASDAT